MSTKDQHGQGSLFNQVLIDGSESRLLLSAITLKKIIADTPLPFIDFRTVCTEYFEQLEIRHSSSALRPEFLCTQKEIHLTPLRSLAVMILLDWFLSVIMKDSSAEKNISIDYNYEEGHELIHFRNNKIKESAPNFFTSDYHDIAHVIEGLGGRVMPVSRGVDIIFYDLEASVYRTMTHSPSRKKILIVEDQSIIALFLKRTLEGAGYQVTDIVEAGEQVMDAVKSEEPDLIIMDIFLRDEMTGIDAARDLARHYAIPVIYATANIEREIMEEAMKTGPHGYIKKPINRTELLHSVATTFSSQSV